MSSREGTLLIIIKKYLVSCKKKNAGQNMWQIYRQTNGKEEIIIDECNGNLVDQLIDQFTGKCTDAYFFGSTSY